jgi:hypothetical protein
MQGSFGRETEPSILKMSNGGLGMGIVGEIRKQKPRSQVESGAFGERKL